MEEKRVLVAGATGYLGQYMVKESKKQGYWVRVLTRDPKKLTHLDEYIDDLFVGEVTNPDSITGICEDIDFVVSAVGITRKKRDLALVYVMTGEYDAAIDLLEHVLSVPFDLGSGITLRISPAWDPLRDHPRFQALLEKYEKEHGI